MPDFNAWLGDTYALSTWRDDVDRSTDTARVISAKSSSIEVYRLGTAQAAQTVRLEVLSVSQAETMGINLTGMRMGMLIVGYKDHATIADTDIRRGDWFQEGDVRYEVKHVIPDTPKRFLAVAEAMDYGV